MGGHGARVGRTTMKGQRSGRSSVMIWGIALLHALPITLLVLGLFYYWFAVADRCLVFLYEHNMGPRVPDTSPFSFVTSSRYWMAGLVASGAVMVFHAAANWVLKRWSWSYRPPGWWRVWALCAVPVAIGVLWITMTVNRPTLPLGVALRSVLSTWIGLALALAPGRMAAERPGEFGLLVLDGTGLMCVLTSVPGLEYLSYWRTTATGGVPQVRMMVLLVTAGLLLLLAGTLWRLWRRTPIPQASRMYVAGLCVAYLFMPLIHHVWYTDGYRYISDSDNFFTRNMVLQAATFGAAALLALGFTRLRQRLVAFRRHLARSSA